MYVCFLLATRTYRSWSGIYVFAPHEGHCVCVTGPHGSTSFAYAKYDRDPATSITVATSMTSILFDNFIRLKTFPCEIVAHLPRVVPIKHALRQKAWRYAPFAAKTSSYRRPPCFGLRMYSLPDFQIRIPEFPKPDSPQKAGDHGNPRRNASLFLWGFLPPLPSVAFSLARSAKSVEPPRSLQGFFPEICRNHIVCPPFILSGVGVALGTVYHTAPILSTISRQFQEFRRFSQIPLIHFVQIALNYRCNLPCPPHPFPRPPLPDSGTIFVAFSPHFAVFAPCNSGENLLYY